MFYSILTIRLLGHPVTRVAHKHNGRTIFIYVRHASVQTPERRTFSVNERCTEKPIKNIQLDFQFFTLCFGCDFVTECHKPPPNVLPVQKCTAHAVNGAFSQLLQLLCRQRPPPPPEQRARPRTPFLRENSSARAEPTSPDRSPPPPPPPT